MIDHALYADPADLMADLELRRQQAHEDGIRYIIGGVQRTLIDGWELGPMRQERSPMTGLMTLRIDLSYPLYGWSCTLRWAEGDGNPASTLIRQATAYVDECMASTIPHPHPKPAQGAQAEARKEWRGDMAQRLASRLASR